MGAQQDADTISVAVGVLMEAFDVSSRDAGGVLAKFTRMTGMSLHDAAVLTIETRGVISWPP